MMSKKIWRPLNTYGLIFIGVVASAVILYAIITL
jgi:hypothetical protein